MEKTKLAEAFVVLASVLVVSSVLWWAFGMNMDMPPVVPNDDVEIAPTTKVPYISYSISNFSCEIHLGNLSMVMSWDYFHVSYELNDDNEYDLKVIIQGFYVNASICIDGIVHGGTLIIDDFEFQSVVEEATQDALREALLEYADVEQWTAEA